MDEKIELKLELKQGVFPATIHMGTQLMNYGISMVQYYMRKEERTIEDISEMNMWVLFVEQMKIFTGVYVLGDSDIFLEFHKAITDFYNERMKETIDTEALKYE